MMAEPVVIVDELVCRARDAVMVEIDSSACKRHGQPGHRHVECQNPACPFSSHPAKVPICVHRRTPERPN